MVISSLILRSETDAILGLPVRRTTVGSTAGRTGLTSSVGNCALKRLVNMP
ncbi:hypothetical protein WKI13_09510 [Teredinibacter turnerae]|uniref:hypothetical protein n=1 Tax=Teredinibacter turnerae TaxID=2426 RepID=UPI00036CDE52|nr:hypothetical protein [Teredinibacter turnerae]